MDWIILVTSNTNTVILIVIVNSTNANIVFTIVISFYRTIFFEKNKLKGGELIGQKYGTLFEVQQGKLVASSLATLENSATGSSLVSAGNANSLIQ